MEIREYSDVELRALEYWERGFRRATKLHKRVMRELHRRLDCLPETEVATEIPYGQVPGLKGARAALRIAREAQRRNR